MYYIRRELADISFIYKLINNEIDAPYLLNCVPFNIPVYNHCFTSMFIITQYNYLKYLQIPRAMALSNKLAKTDVDLFFCPLSMIHTICLNNAM
jgi:hypothetical protein